MADQDINMERFAYDVCVHVLEKFGVFKPPDDRRKQNKYKVYNFLPCISRTVLVYTILVRDKFKNVLEVLYKTGKFNIEIILIVLHKDLLKKGTFKEMDCTGKICLFLAICTEYLLFATTKKFAISLNQIVIGWNNFFERNLRKDFEAEGGFTNIYSSLKSSREDGLDDFFKEFISDYLLPYGAGRCLPVFLRKCSELPVNPLNSSLLGLKNIEVLTGFGNFSGEQCETGELKESVSDNAGIKEPKREINDLDDTSKPPKIEVGDSETPQCGQSKTSNSEISEDKRPQISQDEGSSSTSTREVDDSETPRSPICETSNSEISEDNLPEISQDEGSSSTSTSEVGDSETPQCGQSETSNSEISEDKLPEISQDEGSSSTSTSEVDNSEMPQCGQSETSNSELLQNKLLGIPPHEEMLRGIDPFFVENIPSPPKPQENEPVASEDPPLSSDPEELGERVEEILYKLQHDIEALRNLLFEHSLLSMKSGRRGSVRSEDVKGEKPPKGPEGLI